MKILLLGTPVYNRSKYGRRFFIPYAPPIGLAYIGSVLRREGFDLLIKDAMNSSWRDIASLIRLEKPDVVGASCLTEQRRSVFLLAETVKSVDKKIKVVIGNVHATFLYEQILRNVKSIDIIVMGEGEETFLELAGALESGAGLDNVKGIAYRKDGEIVKTGDRPQIPNLDALPFPTFDDFDFSRYNIYDPIRSFDIRDSNNDLMSYIPVNTSRGCIGRCQFCSVHRFWRGSWRARSPSNVVDEIETLNKEKKAGFINFTDDIFTVNKDRVIGIAREILRRNINIAWDCETRVDFIWPDMVSWMKRAGCISIALGVESGSTAILNAINKNSSVERIREAVHCIRENKIKINMLLMVGNPGESDRTIDETARLVKELKPDIRTVQITTVYPGTPLYDICRNDGIIDDDYWLSDSPAPFYTRETGLRQLKRWQNRLLIDTSSNNVEKILRKIQSVIDERIGIRIAS